MGLTIGRYELERKLAQGSMGAVYLARDPYMKRPVAIKVLAYDLTEDDLCLDFFQREAEAIAALEFPAIVPIYDVGQHGSQPFLVMQYMPGGSLEEKLAAGMRPRPLAQVFKRIAAALDAAHAQNIIHCDVKPANILFDAANKAYLADFGLAKFLDQNTGLTSTMLMGTPEFMSPEQVRGERPLAQSDIYALGITLFYGLTGAYPYDKGNEMATAAAHVKEPVPNIHQFAPDLPAFWQDILQKALAKAPLDRYKTAVALAEDVLAGVNGRWHLNKLLAI